MCTGDKECCITGIGLSKIGHDTPTIFNFLQSLVTSQRFFYRAIEGYSKVGTLENRQRSGRFRTDLTSQTVKALVDVIETLCGNKISWPGQ